MHRSASIPSPPRSELTSAFRGAIHGPWSPGSTTDLSARPATERLPLPLPLAVPLPLPLGVPLESFAKAPLSPTHRALRALSPCRHLCVNRGSVIGPGGWRSSAPCPCAPRARRLRPLLRAGCSASPAYRATGPRLGGGRLMPRQCTTLPPSRRQRGCARSARVLAVRRREADLDRFVAALLALATDPECDGHRPRRSSPRKARRR